jgi:hypothetical protein
LIFSPQPGTSKPKVSVDHLYITFLHVDSSADYQITFTIQDVDMQTYHPAKKGLKARFFEASEQDLPQIVNVGDIILIRHCKVIIPFLSFRHHF